jgi:ABC-type proline/glycine betaine transport system permease subunit
VEVNWVILGWLIDMVLNGFVWLIIAALSLLLLDMTDKWTRKAVEWISKADKRIREFTEKFIDSSFEWIQKKNLKIISSILFLIIFGILAQLEIIPKLIS